MERIRVVVVGCGTMGASHARAYAAIPGFELAGLVDRSEERARTLATALGGVAVYRSLGQAIEKASLGAASICTYPDTHHALAMEALASDLHVFTEKPIATSVAEAEEIVTASARSRRKVVVGYILRHHPAWQRFIEEARKLGKPLVMRMNLNQRSRGSEWDTHKNLMRSMSPIVDCGVHYVDVMCQMTRSRPVGVHAIGARLTEEISPSMYNYGQLQVRFADGSVGWYEAGWGPMMSEVAYFVKDVIGPRGSVSIAEHSSDDRSSEIDSHTRTNRLVLHDALAEESERFIDTADEPDHQELCTREQKFFLNAIRDNLDLTEHLTDAVNSLRIVLAADESVRTGTVVTLREKGEQ